MSKKRDITREEIAKQFVLPERQSKIATLLKQDGQAYCICRSSDSSRFMIGCDACEEWYHGDCINITEREAKNIKQFFCVRCREEDPTLQTRYKPATVSKPVTDDKKSKKRKDKEVKLGSKRCGQCMGCYRTEDCGRCDACKDMKKYGGSNRLKLRCKHRTCINSLQGMSQVKRKRKSSVSEENNSSTIDPILLSDTPRQCYGPRCIKAARIGSKYCSEECGMSLATHRIYQVLPQRIQEWALSPCEAESRNRRALEKIRAQQIEVRRKLEELDRRHAHIDQIIQRSKQVSIDPKLENDMANDDSDLSMYCITCGHEIHNRTAIKHMEKCFNKYEAQASFGSIFKTRIEGNVMFCDFYNPINRTYCKRLRVLCPEHCKEPKVLDNEVCGCPLDAEEFESTMLFCRLPKKVCVKHYAWEKLRRAEVDMERVRQWLKIDELIEQERQLRQSMASRAGVLALMLHSTYNHEVMEQLTAAQDKEAISRELAKRLRKNSS